MFSHPKIKEKTLYVFPFGSTVYGTTTEQSDEDFIVVVEGVEDFSYDIDEEKRNIRVHSEKAFERLIKEHDISALEAIFSNETNYTFSLDKEILRRKIAAIVSNSFSKCRRKLRDDENYDPYGAKKSLFHSLRILDYGIQIASFGKIVDFQKMNKHFFDIMNNPSLDFNDYRRIYEPLAIEMRKELKRVAPLEKDKREKKW